MCQKHGGMHTHNTGKRHKYEKDGTLKRALAGKQPLDRTATAAVQKNILIPSCRSWTVSQNSRKCQKDPEKLVKEEMLPGRQKL
jgi:hypothetical protein